jgi:hypothetical protein
MDTLAFGSMMRTIETGSDALRRGWGFPWVLRCLAAGRQSTLTTPGGMDEKMC